MRVVTRPFPADPSHRSRSIRIRRSQDCMMAHPKLPALVSPQQLAAARERQPEIRLLYVRTPS